MKSLSGISGASQEVFALTQYQTSSRTDDLAELRDMVYECILEVSPRRCLRIKYRSYWDLPGLSPQPGCDGPTGFRTDLSTRTPRISIPIHGTLLSHPSQLQRCQRYLETGYLETGFLNSEQPCV
jgi:hypothetical protein